MKYLKKYNESFFGFRGGSDTKELREALNIFAEDLPFSVDNITIEDMTNMRSKGCKVYRVCYQHIDEEMEARHKDIENKYRDVTHNINWLHFQENTPLESLRKARKQMVCDIESQVTPLFTRFAKKYDMEFSNLKIELEVCDNLPQFDVW